LPPGDAGAILIGVVRRGVLAGVVVAVVAVAVAISLVGTHSSAAAPRAAVHPAARTQVSPPIARTLHAHSHVVVPRRLVVPNTMGQTCFVGVPECAPQKACLELIGSQSSPAVATPTVAVAPAVARAVTPRLATPCTRAAAPPQRVTARPTAPSVAATAGAALPVLGAKLAARPSR
jgi:hypothetical protein